MAPVRTVKDIRITVPRHNSQRISGKLSVELRKQGKAQGHLVETVQPSSRLAQAIESASDWNSLLMTAKAERGPQWDVGTQQFLVDKYSDLYYDSTLLFEAVKKATEGESGEHSTSQSQLQPQQNIHLTSQQHTFQVQQVPPSMSTRSHHTPRRDLPIDYGMSPAAHMRDQSPHRPTGVNPYPASPAGMNMNMGMNMRGPPGGVPYPGSGPPFSQPGNQFMGGDLTTAGSPMRMGGGSNIGMGGGLRPGMGGMPAAGMPLGTSVIGGIGGPGMAGMGAPGMGGMSAPGMGGMGPLGMGGMGASGMGNMAGMGGGGMMGGMSGGMGGMGTGIGGNMTMAGPNMGMGMGMGMVNMGVDHGGMGIGMSPRAMRGIPDDFSGIH